MSRARFITLEGGEGAGKSTQAKRLAEELQQLGHEVLLTREPGGSDGAEAIRSLLVEGDPDRWTPLSETLLHFAARADHLARTVRPALDAGKWVICDRFIDSTMAYQGMTQGLGLEPIHKLVNMVVGKDMPALTLVLDLPVETGLSRAKGRAGKEDRYERMGLDFHQRLRSAFMTLAKAYPDRCVLVDAALDMDMVAAQIWGAVSSRLNP
ncbi:MAG: dTMP kinase [Rhizobiales bacterium]|nr:dTMP kinase [Hyphomicrobiales bacterium]